MRRSLIGPTLRERRRALGITQSKLAAEVGISASYLNLIEGDKRNIGGVLLKRIADALGLALDELDGAAERRLVDDLGETVSRSGERAYHQTGQAAAYVSGAVRSEPLAFLLGIGAIGFALGVLFSRR